jgi:hypothetical protein
MQITVWRPSCRPGKTDTGMNIHSETIRERIIRIEEAYRHLFLFCFAFCLTGRAPQITDGPDKSERKTKYRYVQVNLINPIAHRSPNPNPPSTYTPF